MAWEGRKYKLDKSENFEEYMKALGELEKIIDHQLGGVTIFKNAPGARKKSIFCLSTW